MNRHWQRFAQRRINRQSMQEKLPLTAIRPSTPLSAVTRMIATSSLLITIASCAQQPVVLQSPCPAVKFPQELLQQTPDEYLLPAEITSPSKKDAPSQH